MVKKLAFAIVAAAFLATPVLAQTTPAPAPAAPSAEPATPAAPAKTAMKKKAKNPAKKPVGHAKPKAPAGGQPPASDQD
jgi:biopolymer transport protein ExbB